MNIYDTSYILNKLNECKKDEEKINTVDDLKTYLANEAHTQELLSAFSDLRLKFASAFNLDSISFVTGNGTSMYAGSNDTRGFKLSTYIDDAKYSRIQDELSHIITSDMEKALNQINILCESKRIVGAKDKFKAYQQLIKAIKSDLIKSFVNSIDYSKLSAHEILFRKLCYYGALNRVNIFTANYDLAFEYSLDQLGIEYNDGFSGFVNRKFSPKTLESSHLLTIDKFHGSVNWVIEEGSIGSDSIKEVQPKFNKVVFKDKGKEVEEVKAEINSNADQVLIYPTSNKLYQTYSTPYSELMRFMLDKFESKRNVIIVIGYKYGDEHINEILLKALANPGNVFYFLDYDNDSNNDFINNMKKLTDQLPNINILSGHILADFQIFVKYIVPATYEKTDEEMIKDLLKKVTNERGMVS